ncbi:hypothetical protein LINPERPRIM_LOCUS16011 [Linum perenne]
MAGGRFRELLKKYGKVALGVHFSVSAASISGLYVALRNNVDVESVFDKLHLPGLSSNNEEEASVAADPNQQAPLVEGVAIEEKTKSGRNRVAELAASSGGTLALALLFNKALFPIRVPITIALTPAVARALARRGMIRSV